VRRLLFSLAAAAGLVASVVGCSGSPAPVTSPPTLPVPSVSISTPTPTPVPATETAPLHAVPSGATAVWGSAGCDATDDGTDADGGPGRLVVCTFEMSDPRVTGTQRFDRFTFVDGGSVGRAWTASVARITNAEGAWQGSAQGAEDRAAGFIGEAHFFGEGAYDGLEFHAYVQHLDVRERTYVNGWIAPSVTPGALSPAESAAPFHAMPADSVVVSGSATCEFLEAVECQLDVSDGRVSGAETQDLFRFMVGTPFSGDVWLAQTVVLRTPDGSWHGIAQGAEDIRAVPIGEVDYVGEGAYLGLAFHYYLAQPDIAEDGPTLVRGWISGEG
jgi:hypothetical protein